MRTFHPYCLMPWIHFHVGNKGLVKACCVSNIPYGDSNRQEFNEIWNGDSIQSLRIKFLKGEKDKRCAVCHKMEEAGGKSIRQETFERFPNVRIQDETPARYPIYFDIRFSNVCNLRCRTCWHGNSSRWFEDAKCLKTNLGEKAILKNIEDFDAFIEKTGEALLQAKEIYFAGGEPLVTEEHYLLLQWLIENKATNIRLRYNTNFSTLGYKSHDILSYWQHFPSVEVWASIDAIGALGEYIRKDSSWAVFLENRKKIKHMPHVQFWIAPTISVFNVRHLPQLYRYCVEQEIIAPENLYINILERPYHYNVKALPPSYKNKVVQEYQAFYAWLREQGVSESIRVKFQECLDYMEAEDLSKHWPRFLAETEQLDQLRGESRKDVLTFE